MATFGMLTRCNSGRFRLPHVGKSLRKFSGRVPAAAGAPARSRDLIYRFARAADDFADEGELPSRERLALLAGFDDELRRIERGAPLRLSLFQELAPIIGEYRLPLDLFRDLLSAFAQDVTKQRYANFAELLDYSRRSANPVGRLLLALYGAATPQNLEWSDNICTSLQIINFLQDIAIDYAKGRIYMPQDELARYQVSETQIAAHDTGKAWREFMIFQIERASQHVMARRPARPRAQGPHRARDAHDYRRRRPHSHENRECALRYIPPPPPAARV